ncbi:MAG: glycosyltransferase family 4 protein, partial [Petrotogales bacterium]
PQRLSHRFFRSLKYRGLREADAIIAISDRTKEDLINYFRIPESKVYRVYQGVDLKSRWSDDDLDSLVFKFDLPRDKRYILFVGTEIPRKNFKTVIKSFARVMRTVKDIHLIKVGKGRYSYSKHYKLIKNLGLEKNITFIEHVNNLDLEGLYNLSELFVFPSLYEGFGLPPLEAMACGTPVVTSNTSSLPEVVGDAGIMVNPYDVDELAESMERVLESENLQEELIRKGLERAEQFSWERTAKETLKVYMDVLNRA